MSDTLTLDGCVSGQSSQQGMTATDTHIRHQPTGEETQVQNVRMSSTCLELVVETCG